MDNIRVGFATVGIISVFVICLVISVPLEPGQQGGPWTSEEIDIVREKVHEYN